MRLQRHRNGGHDMTKCSFCFLFPLLRFGIGKRRRRFRPLIRRVCMLTNSTSHPQAYTPFVFTYLTDLFICWTKQGAVVFKRKNNKKKVEDTKTIAFTIACGSQNTAPWFRTRACVCSRFGCKRDLEEKTIFRKISKCRSSRKQKPDTLTRN